MNHLETQLIAQMEMVYVCLTTSFLSISCSLARIPFIVSIDHNTYDVKLKTKAMACDDALPHLSLILFRLQCLPYRFNSRFE